MGHTTSRCTTSPRRAWTQVAAATGALIGGLALYLTQVHFDGILAVELSGSSQVVDGTWSPAAGLRGALFWDFFLIAGYGACLLLLNDLARRLFWTSTAGYLAVAAWHAAAVAIVADIVENVLLLAATQWTGNAEWPLGLAAGAAGLKFSVLLLAVPVAVVAILTTLYRLFSDAARKRPDTVEMYKPEPGGPTPPTAPCTPTGGRALAPQQDQQEAGTAADAPPASDVHGQRWTAGYQVPDVEIALGKDKTRIGFCVSGGGIRSASVAMGALQGLRETLLRARYLTSVSGGGYTAGALQMALQPPRDDKGTPTGSAVATPLDVFLPGIPEEDHLRRHSSYIADGAAQWVLALGVVLRGLLASLLLVTAAVSALGLTLGLFFRGVPLVGDLGTLTPRSGGLALSYPAPTEAMTAAILGVGGLAVLVYVISLVALSGTGRWWQRGRSLSKALAGLTMLLVVVGVALPGLVWASAAGPDPRRRRSPYRPRQRWWWRHPAELRRRARLHGVATAAGARQDARTLPQDR